jgi:hypothetical protein
VKEDILALQMELELGEISDEEFVEREAELMKRLREVREWREFFGMETRGGPVRVSSEGDEGESAARGDEQGGVVSAGDAAIELGWDEPS